MLTQHRCVSVQCDRCGDDPARGDVPAGFATETAALSAVAALGWSVREDGAVRCPACGPVPGGHEAGGRPWTGQDPTPGAAAFLGVGAGVVESSGEPCGHDWCGPLYRPDAAAPPYRVCRRCDREEVLAAATVRGAGELTPTQRQARFLTALAAHLEAHPQLGELAAVFLHDRPSVNLARCYRAAELAGWARSLGVERLRAMAISGEHWSSVTASARLGGIECEVWERIDALPRELTCLTVEELEHLAEHGVLDQPALPKPDTAGGRS